MLKELNIEDMIREIRGKQVMLDSDLAKLYQCKNGTKDINKAVSRNVEKFPEDFYFQLSKREYKNILRFQNGTLEVKQGQYSKYLPYVFTEQGVAMLATVLKTDVAAKVSINIMRAFVEMRRCISTNIYNNRISNVEAKVLEHDNKFDEIFKKLDNTVNNHIFFEGQIYDAYSLLLDIFDKSKEEIIIIDNYVDKKLLDVLSKTNKKIIIYSKNYNEELINKYNKEYTNVTCKYTNKFHDRFIIIDKSILYHSGASFKELGNKCFALNKIEDVKILKEIIEELN